MTVIIAILIAGLPAMAAKASRKPAAIPPRQLEVTLKEVVPVKPVAPLNQDSVALAIPTDIKETSSSQDVQAQIIDHNIQSLVQGKYLKNSPVVQTAQKVQEAMKPSVSFGDKDGVQHKVDLEVEAIQSLAKLKYKGYINTNFVYASREDSLAVSLSEDLSQSTRLSLEHESKTDLSMVKLNVEW